MLDDLAVDGWHRDADGYLVQRELQRAFAGDTVIAIDRGDEPARVGVAVDRRHRRSRVREQTQVRRAIFAKPGIDLPDRSAREHREMMVEVEACSEHRSRSGQHHGAIGEFGFQTIERRVKVGEEGWVLRVDLVGVHRHHGHVRVLAFNGPGHRSSYGLEITGYGRSGKLEQAPGVVRQECRTGFGAELEVVEAGDALARGPEGMVGSEKNAMPLVPAHVVDQIGRVAADLIGRRVDEDASRTARSP
jgi:hypothetical protein